jgi:YD repeat-containing protein
VPGEQFPILQYVLDAGNRDGFQADGVWWHRLPHRRTSFAYWLHRLRPCLAVSTGSSGVQYSRSDGGFWIFGTNGNVAAPSNVTATLSSGTTYWTITFQNGEQRRFDNTSGSLIAIIDRNGNTTQLAYDGTNRLTTVTDAAGRHLYFNYSGSSSLVTGVTSDVGLTLAYSYDTQGRLSQITKPDSTTISFQYNTNSLISAVLDSNGKVLESHTYDSKGRGLTSSKANGVEAVSVSYAGE